MREISPSVWPILGDGIKRVLFVTATNSKRTPLQTQQEGVVPFSGRPHGLTQNLSLEK